MHRIDRMRPSTSLLLQSLHLFDFAESLGGVGSLVEHPETMSHASMPEAARRAAGITEGNLRVSVGIEAKDDLIEDLAAGLDQLRQ